MTPRSMIPGMTRPLYYPTILTGRSIFGGAWTLRTFRPTRSPDKARRVVDKHRTSGFIEKRVDLPADRFVVAERDASGRWWQVNQAWSYTESELSGDVEPSYRNLR